MHNKLVKNHVRQEQGYNDSILQQPLKWVGCSCNLNYCLLFEREQLHFLALDIQESNNG
jgi:hypothetical protein